MHDIIIIGGGPGGLTAAVYALRAGKSVLVLEKDSFGGQISWSPRVENFPGFVAVSGVELSDKFLQQAMEQGAELELEEAAALRAQDGCYCVDCLSGLSYQAKAVIIATGAKPRSLGLEKEQELVGQGVCYCAVCDGAFFAGRDVAVCGGGNSALQDAMLLSEKCRKVYLIHRRDSFRGEAKLLDALKAKDNVELVLNARISALQGQEQLEAITVEQQGESFTLPVEGLFVAVGHSPDLQRFGGLMDLDEAGYALSGEDCLSKTPGIFVAGDCRKKSVRQLTTAVADGACAAIAACNYLDTL